MATSFTVIVPAHDEAGVIAATLARWRGAIEPECVIVVANGCHDATAAEAGRGLPGARIVETPVAGKANAINLGLDAAAPGVVLIVDADVAIAPGALQALADALSAPRVGAASPAVAFDLTGADAVVRGYYRAFRRHPYLTQGIGGAGVYGLSAEGRRRIGRLPPVLSDDDYVRYFFRPEELLRVSTDTHGAPVCATVSPPRHWNELVRTEARWRAGDASVRALATEGVARRGPQNLARAWRAGEVPLAAMATYVAIKLLGRARSRLHRLRRTSHVWHRDQSSRTTPVVVDR